MRRRFLLLLVLFWGASALSGCTADAKKERWLRRAEEDLKAGDYDKAKIDFMKVLQFDQRNVTAYEQLGRLWLEDGAPLRAGPFLKRAQELAPGNSANRVRLARAYQAIGQRDEARKELLAVLNQSPQEVEALVTLTELAQKPEEIEETEKLLENFPAKDSASYQIALGNLALRNGDLAAAEAAVQKAVAIAPKSPEPHQALGVLHLLRKDLPAAGVDFKTAAELAPPRSPAQIVYAEYQRQAAGAEAAKATLTSLTKKAPDFLTAWILLARIAFSEKKYDDALQLLGNVFSRDSQNLDGRVLQSDIWLAQREPKKAIEELGRIEKDFPGLPPVKLRLAQAYLQQNNPAQATAALDEALSKNPDFVEAIVARAELNLRTGNTTAAISALEGALKKQPGFKPAQLLLAAAYRVSGDLDKAAAIFEEQIKAAPAAPEPYFFLGLVQQQQKKPADARQSFEKVLELSPDNIQAVSQLIDLDLQAKDFAAAQGRVQRELEKHPDAAASYLLQGKTFMAQEKWTEAETVLKKAVELDPNQGLGYDMLVALYLATNKLPDAVRELEAVFAKNPKNARVLMTLGLIEEKQKNYLKARDAYEKLLTINPDFVPALNNLSYIYADRLDQPDRAVELARKARDLAPNDSSVTDTLGWALFKRGDYEHALTFLQESADKAPDSPEIRFHLGMAFYMMGRVDAARAAFQQALASTNDFPSKSEASNRLDLLGDGSASPGTMAIAQLEELLAKQPNDLVARMRLADAYEKQGNSEKAAAAYEAALQVNPKLASAALKLAQLYGGPLSNKEKALTYAKTARALSPQDPKATAVLGRIAFDSGEYSWSYSLLQESVRASDTDPKVLYDFAWAAYGNGKVAEARSAMERCLKSSPDAVTADEAQEFLDLTALSAETPDLSAAKARIDAKLNAQPGYVPALMASAALNLQSGNKDAAITKYQEVLRRFPDFAPAQAQLALLYAGNSDRKTEAYDLAVKARNALPGDPAVAELLGRLSYERKDYSRAIQLLKESAKKRPLDGIGKYILGMAFKENRQRREAIAALKEALAESLPTEVAQEARRTLTELEKDDTK